MAVPVHHALPVLRGALVRAAPAVTVVVDTDAESDEPAGSQTLTVRVPVSSEGEPGAGGPGLGQLAAQLEGFVAEHGSPPRRITIQDGPTVVVGSTLTPAAERLSEELPREMRPGRDGIVDGRVAVVTGGAQGFGEEIVRALVDCGARVFIADLNAEGAAALSGELNASHGPVTHGVQVDVSSDESVAAMIDQVVGMAGGLDLFVSNAGVLKAGSVKEMAASDFDFVTRVNYTGFFLCTKHASRVMAVQNRYAPSDRFTDIVQINSKSGLAGSNRNGAYAGSKFGSLGLAQSFALELVSDRIKVNAICPGNFFDGPLWSDPDRGLFVQYLQAGKVPGAQSIADVKAHYEAQVPMGRGCRGEDVVHALLYVVEQRYETGQAVPVTGGQIMLS